MTNIATIIIERRSGDIWSAKFAETDRFQSEAKQLGTAIVRLIDLLGQGTVKFDAWTETKNLTQGNYREFHVPLTERGSFAMLADASPLHHDCRMNVT